MGIQRVQYLVVGSGGNAMSPAILMQRAGITDIRMITKHTDFGGAWFQNRYPGCEVDVPSIAYQLDHDRTYDWEDAFISREELFKYFQDVARKNDLYSITDFDTELLRAEWDGAENHWVVATNRDTYHAQFLVVATGFLEEITYPEIKGIESFEGPVFHSAEWPEDYTGEGDRVAVLGCGSSAIQVVPEMQKVAEKVINFARTPTYVLPKNVRKLTEEEKDPTQVRRVVAEQGAFFDQYWNSLTAATAEENAQFEQEALEFMHSQVKDPELRELLTPDHRFACKRSPFSDDYYASLANPNVQVVRSGVVSAKPNSIIDENGDEYEVDALVLATGFYYGGHILDRIIRRDGESVESYQDGHPRAYKAVSVAQCPNLYLVGGAAPNGQIWNGLYPGEAVGRYIIATHEYMRVNQVTALEIREDVELAWKEEADRKLDIGATVVGGCVNYSQDEKGHNKAAWPGTLTSMGEALSQIEPDDYVSVGSAMNEPVPA